MKFMELLQMFLQNIGTKAAPKANKTGWNKQHSKIKKIGNIFCEPVKFCSQICIMLFTVLMIIGKFKAIIMYETTAKVTFIIKTEDAMTALVLLISFKSDLRDS